jgi:hypothetical protein
MTKAIIFTDMAGYYGFGRAAGAYRIASEFRTRGDDIKVVDCFCSLTLAQIKSIIKDRITSKTEWIGFSTTFMINQETSSILDTKRNQAKNRVTAIEKKQFDTPTGLSKTEEWDLVEWIKSLNLQVIFGGWNATYTAIHPYVKIISGPCEDKFFKDFSFTTSQITYTQDDYIQPGEDLPIEVARGCIFKCKFCHYPLNGKRLWEFVKSPEVLRDEMMRNYEQYGTTGYMISDDTYNDSPEKVKSLLEMYRTLPFDLRFSTYARLDLLISHPETQDMLYESGMRSVFFGIESLNHEAGKFVGKGMHPDKVKRGLLDFKEKYPDMLIYASMIGGLPTETIDELEQSFQFLTQEANISNVAFVPLSLTSGSDMSLNAERYGYTRSSNDPRGWTRTDGLTSQEVREWCIEKTRQRQNHPGGYVFYNRVRNIGYTDDELAQLTFANDTQELIKRTDVKRTEYLKNIL